MKHIVGFSGGIDSQACARWVLNQYPSEDVLLLNSDAGGNEHPLTTEFVRWYSENVHPVVVIQPIIADMWKTEDFASTKGLDGNAPLTFDLMSIMKKRFPSRVAQFCTEILKIRPQQRWVKQMFGPAGPWAGEEYLRYTGIRRDESEGRKDTPLVRWDEYYDCEVHAPICDWTKQQCFDYVKAHGEQVNPLYAMGFNRVGCAPCVNSGKQDILNWATRFPEMIDKIRLWESRVREAVPHAQGNFFPPNIIPGKNTGPVDEVVEWSKSGRGGRQQLFPIMLERPA